MGQFMDTTMDGPLGTNVKHKQQNKSNNNENNKSTVMSQFMDTMTDGPFDTNVEHKLKTKATKIEINYKRIIQNSNRVLDSSLHAINLNRLNILFKLVC